MNCAENCPHDPPCGPVDSLSKMPNPENDETNNPRLLSARAGRLRTYIKASIDASDWQAARGAIDELRKLETAFGDVQGGSDVTTRLHALERAFAAILAGMQPSGQKHPFYDAVSEGKPVRFVFSKNREGKLVVNFVPLEVEG